MISTRSPRRSRRSQLRIHVYHRVLIGQRIDGIVHVFDEPNGTGTTYTVEAGLESKAALDALIADYLAKAKRIGYAPMHGWF